MDELLLYSEILWPALLAGVLVLSTHVPLGQEVLKRGIIFLDLAIAQIAALGLVLASAFGIETQDQHSAWLTQAIAITAAVAGAMLLYQFRHAPAKIQEALIGVLFMLAATGSLLLLAKDPHAGERLKALLIGQILWVKPATLLVTALVYSAILMVWLFLRNRLGEWGFYPLFAITITLSTQMVGVYLVFASLIIPALATLTSKRALLSAYVLGISAYACGLIASALLDLPSGALIAWCLALFGTLYFLFQRKRAAGALIEAE